MNPRKEDPLDITTEFIKAKRPCAPGWRWFLRNGMEGSRYQEVLDGLVAAGRVHDACWLLDQFGPTHDVLVVDTLAVDALVFAGPVEVRGGVESSALLRVGRRLTAGGSVRGDGGVATGDDLRCGYPWMLDEGACLLSGARQSEASHRLWRALGRSRPLRFARVRPKALHDLGTEAPESAFVDLDTRLLLLGRGRTVDSVVHRQASVGSVYSNS